MGPLRAGHAGNRGTAVESDPGRRCHACPCRSRIAHSLTAAVCPSGSQASHTVGQNISHPTSDGEGRNCRISGHCTTPVFTYFCPAVSTVRSRITGSAANQAPRGGRQQRAGAGAMWVGVASISGGTETGPNTAPGGGWGLEYLPSAVTPKDDRMTVATVGFSFWYRPSRQCVLQWANGTPTLHVHTDRRKAWPTNRRPRSVTGLTAPRRGYAVPAAVVSAVAVRPRRVRACDASRVRRV